MTIYYNNECSKSKGCFAILVEEGVEADVVNYLVDDISEKELRELIRKLGIKPEELVRKSEELYQSRFSGMELSDEEWIQVLLENRVLIERPLVVMGDKAIIARPPEKVYELLKK